MDVTSAEIVLSSNRNAKKPDSQCLKETQMHLRTNSRSLEGSRPNWLINEDVTVKRLTVLKSIANAFTQELNVLTFAIAKDA